MMTNIIKTLENGKIVNIKEAMRIAKEHLNFILDNNARDINRRIDIDRESFKEGAESLKIIYNRGIKEICLYKGKGISESVRLVPANNEYGFLPKLQVKT